MNLDLFADLPEATSTEPKAASLPNPVPSPVAAAKAAEQIVSLPSFSPEAQAWGEAAVEDLAAAADAKTRLKLLKQYSHAYQELISGCLYVAWRKSVSYERALAELTGIADHLTGWVVKEPQLAYASERLTRSHLAVNEVAMLPSHLHPNIS